MADLETLAHRLDDAMRQAMAIPQLAEPLQPSDAYAVQKRAFALRLARGERQVGIKMGFTSRAKMQQMGISDMIWGRLSDRMIIEEGGALPASAFLHPRVEPEVAFLLRRPLVGALTAAQALDAVEAIAPALEVIDSRYADFKFSLTDVIADNASSAGFVTGAWQKPTFDVGNLGLILSCDGRPVQIGSSAAILGHPLRALLAAARFAGEAEEPLQPGWIVMAGGATAAEALRPGVHVSLEMQGLGRVAFSVAA